MYNRAVINQKPGFGVQSSCKAALHAWDSLFQTPLVRVMCDASIKSWKLRVGCCSSPVAPAGDAPPLPGGHLALAGDIFVFVMTWVRGGVLLASGERGQGCC